LVNYLRLKTLADVQQLPDEYRQRSRWRYVEKQIIDAARGGDARLHGEMLEGVECNE